MESIDFLALGLLIAGGPVALIGLYKLIRHGITLLPWIVLLGVGIGGVMYGLYHVDEALPAVVSNKLMKQTKYVDLKQTVAQWCAQLNE